MYNVTLGGIDWSQPLNHKTEEELVLNWDDDVAENNDSDSPPLSMKLDGKNTDDGKLMEKDGK